MRKIVFALMGLTASLVMGDMGVCQKNCGIDFGKCLILEDNLEVCLKQEGACALECLKGLTVEGNYHGPNHRHHSPAVRSNEAEVCQKNCGIDAGKCMIQTFDLKKCAKEEAACALDCLKGVQFVAKWDKPVVPHVKDDKQGVCQKNCAIDLGKCVILTGKPIQCAKEEAACALECLKGLTVESSHKVKNGGDVCQKNCGIDSAKCMIQTFDLKQCAKDEAACALDCLKGVHSPHVRSVRCSACQHAAGKIEGKIAAYGCKAAMPEIDAICDITFTGPQDALEDICTLGFHQYCNTFADWIAKQSYTPAKACQKIRLC